jgi:hypothetical protein
VLRLYGGCRSTQRFFTDARADGSKSHRCQPPVATEFIIRPVFFVSSILIVTGRLVRPRYAHLAMNADIWNVLHDGPIDRITGTIPGDIQFAVAIRYLRERCTAISYQR